MRNCSISWDLSNARFIRVEPSSGDITLTGYASVDPVQLQPAGRLTQTTYYLRTFGLLIRSQDIQDEPGVKRIWTEAAARGVKAIEIEPLGLSEQNLKMLLAGHPVPLTEAARIRLQTFEEKGTHREHVEVWVR